MNEDLKNYLIHCYLYYVLNAPIISDTAFDKLCKKLLDSGVKSDLVSENDLKAGTGYSIKEYPPEIIEEATAMASKPAAPESTTEFEDRRMEPIQFTEKPGETYFLIGLYRDYTHFRLAEKAAEVRRELDRRWKEGIHKEEFEKYYEDHRYHLT